MRRPSSAAQRAVLARAEVSGPLGGDPSEPAVLEFLQRLAALEHGHALVACGARRRLCRGAEAGSAGAGARPCMQLLADCAEASAPLNGRRAAHWVGSSCEAGGRGQGGVRGGGDRG